VSLSTLRNRISRDGGPAHERHARDVDVVGAELLDLVDDRLAEPFSTDATVTTSSTPMKMPSTVRNDRKRFASSVSNARRVRSRGL
jgi:hypothetical protein